jgi:hypothetical protein
MFGDLVKAAKGLARLTAHVSELRFVDSALKALQEDN